MDCEYLSIEQRGIMDCEYLSIEQRLWIFDPNYTK
jgi:hypothetical protein